MIFFDLKHLLDLKHLNAFKHVREKERVIDLAVEVNFFSRHLWRRRASAPQMSRNAAANSNMKIGHFKARRGFGGAPPRRRGFVDFFEICAASRRRGGKF